MSDALFWIVFLSGASLGAMLCAFADVIAILIRRDDDDDS